MGRAPHGARGLKLELVALAVDMGARSRPAWGAWIETPRIQSVIRLSRVAPRMGRVD